MDAHDSPRALDERTVEPHEGGVGFGTRRESVPSDRTNRHALGIDRLNAMADAKRS